MTCQCGVCRKCRHRVYIRRWRAQRPTKKRSEWLQKFAEGIYALEMAYFCRIARLARGM